MTCKSHANGKEQGLKCLDGPERDPAILTTNPEALLSGIRGSDLHYIQMTHVNPAASSLSRSETNSSSYGRSPGDASPLSSW